MQSVSVIASIVSGWNTSNNNKNNNSSFIHQYNKVGRSSVKPKNNSNYNSSCNGYNNNTNQYIYQRLFLFMLLSIISTSIIFLISYSRTLSFSMGQAASKHSKLTRAATATISSRGSVSGVTTGISSDLKMSTSNNIMSDNKSVQQQELENKRTILESALWSYFAGDALASPTHWFYGGYPQIQQYYGTNGITTYTKPVHTLHGSILNKSNLSGGGRSSGSSNTQKRDPPSIIGYVINHGKQDLWDSNKQIHYHTTLQSGENTLEVQIGRVLMKSIVTNNGNVNKDHFRDEYIKFMTTPNSHNDTYASTCHRMFFQNLIYNKLDPSNCPDNDSHNVDTIDGLVLPTIAALAISGKNGGATMEEAEQAAADIASVTRRSSQLQQYSKQWGRFIYQLINDNEVVDTSSSHTIQDTTRVLVNEMAKSLQLRKPTIRGTDEITACYLNSATPAMLDTVVKYTSKTTYSIWDSLVANANTGGENVHRGSCLGAVLGIVAAKQSLVTTSTDATTTTTTVAPAQKDTQLVQGLYNHNELQQEIHDFINAITK